MYSERDEFTHSGLLDTPFPEDEGYGGYTDQPMPAQHFASTAKAHLQSNMMFYIVIGILTILTIVGFALYGVTNNAKDENEQKVNQLATSNTILTTQNTNLTAANTSLTAQKTALQAEKATLLISNSDLSIVAASNAKYQITGLYRSGDETLAITYNGSNEILVGTLPQATGSHLEVVLADGQLSAGSILGSNASVTYDALVKTTIDVTATPVFIHTTKYTLQGNGNWTCTLNSGLLVWNSLAQSVTVSSTIALAQTYIKVFTLTP